MTVTRTVVVTGGLGGAGLVPALVRVIGYDALTAVVNVGDDFDWFGLRVCPDIDTVLYALAGVFDGERGWGIAGDSFTTVAALGDLGAAPWFGIGDRDMATHLRRSELLASGLTLTEVTRELATVLGAGPVAVVPAADHPSPTRLVLDDGGTVDFQDWYVRRQGVPPVHAIVAGGGPAAPGVVAALAAAQAVVLGPSNPVTSIGPVLALDGVRSAIAAVPVRIAVSPVVCGGDAPRAGVEHHSRARRAVLGASGDHDNPAGIAAYYARTYPGLVGTFVLDHRDAAAADAVAAVGMQPVLGDLLDPQALAQVVADLVGTAAGPAPGPALGAMPVGARSASNAVSRSAAIAGVPSPKARHRSSMPDLPAPTSR